jgi:hypothetical protein
MGGSDPHAQKPADGPDHPLLSLVPAADRVRVLAKAHFLLGADPADRLHSGQLYQLRSVALTVAAMAPWLTIEKLALLLRYCMWTVRLDARLDDPGASLDDVRERAASTLATLDGDDPEPELAAILAGLRRHDPTGTLLADFTAALRDAVLAGVEHAELSRRVADGQQPPTAEQYLDLASRDVNYRSVAVTLLLLVGPATGGRSAVGSRLEAAIGHACHAVRLANDLSTAGADRADGQLNVLDLHTADGWPVTTGDARRWLDRHVDAHAALLARASRHGLREQCQALANGLRMAVGLYRLAESPTHAE